MKKENLDKFYHSLWLLVKNGVTLIKALEISKEIIINEEEPMHQKSSAKYNKMIKDWEIGGNLSKAFKESGLFNQVDCELISIATTVNGNRIFLELAEYYSKCK